jgi:hypothetical protein
MAAARLLLVALKKLSFEINGAQVSQEISIPPKLDHGVHS